ncbi:MAG: anthranilate phosphoribosyltransferase [Planctomycetia bacterium]|nr:anthranilate phosphoribosyltransferase [Planctomycetia bacterium]
MSSAPQHALLGRLAAGAGLTLDETAEAVGGIMQGQWSEGEIGLFLTGLREKGETAEELAGAATAMRSQMRRIKTSRTGIIDTCGTGGVGSTIFNVSTTAALVTAAAGVPVAKHGNRRVTSRSGSADVLAELGVNVQAELEVVERSLEELGICFCFAPLMHSAMKHVAPVRQKLGGRTIFNLLGPLTNPAGAEFQLLGVGRTELRALLAEALVLLKTERAVVVSGDDGLGEVTIAGATQVTEVDKLRRSYTADERAVAETLATELKHPREYVWQPQDFDVEVQTLETAHVDSPAASAAIIRSVLGGAQGPARDLVVVNAAAALWTAGRAPTTLASAALAREAIDSGDAERLLARLVKITNP